MKADGQIAFEAYWDAAPKGWRRPGPFESQAPRSQEPWAAVERVVKQPLVEVLTQIEWCIEEFDQDGGIDGTFYNHCPVCEEPQHLGHDPNCAIGRILAPYKKPKNVVVNWQPIDTAPRSGRTILLYAPDSSEMDYPVPVVVVGYWATDTWLSDVGDGSPKKVPFNPTHWKPLKLPTDGSA